MPPSIHPQVHINTLPETKYTWNEWTKTVNPAEPRRVYQRFASWLRPGDKKTRMDLTYKTGKNDDYEREDFNPIKHVKIGFFSSAIGVQAAAAMFKFMAMVPSFGTPDLVWQILTLISLVWTSLFLFPYLLKMVIYPRKIYREWQNPVHQNGFTIPFMILTVGGPHNTTCMSVCRCCKHHFVCELYILYIDPALQLKWVHDCRERHIPHLLYAYLLTAE